METTLPLGGVPGAAVGEVLVAVGLELLPAVLAHLGVWGRERHREGEREREREREKREASETGESERDRARVREEQEVSERGTYRERQGEKKSMNKQYEHSTFLMRRAIDQGHRAITALPLSMQ